MAKLITLHVSHPDDCPLRTLDMNFTNEEAVHSAAIDLCFRGFIVRREWPTQTYKNADLAVADAMLFFHQTGE